MARALKEAFEGTAVVLTPDLPLHPKEALKEIRSIIDREQPDLLLGNSCGSFLAQMLAPVVGIPALLGNPYFMMTEFLKERIGEHEYKAPRRDGNQRLVIDEALIEEFAELAKGSTKALRSMAKIERASCMLLIFLMPKKLWSCIKSMASRWLP